MNRKVSSILAAIWRYLDPSAVSCTKSMFQPFSDLMSAKPPDEKARRRLIVCKKNTTHEERVEEYGAGKGTERNIN